MRRSSIPIASLLLAVAACGGGSNAGAGGGASLSDEDALLLGNGLASRIAQSTYLSRQMVVEGVYQATMLGGGLQTGKVVEHGTLKQTMLGGYRYTNTPADKLVLELKGATHEFEVREVQGNTQAATPAVWLDSNHQLEYLHRIPDVCEVVVEANRVGMGWAAHMTGWYVEESQRYELDMKAEGGSYFEQGGRSGQESKTDYKLAGKVTGKGLELTVDERHFFHLVSMGDAVTMSVDENRNTLKTGGVKYRFVDTSVTKVFRTTAGRMMPVFDAAEKWQAKGDVTRSGKQFGKFGLGAGGKSVDANRKYHGTIDIQITLPDKKVVTLQSFRGS